MWHIVIDMSGLPPEEVHIGLVLFNDNYKPSFLNEFYQEFAYLKSYHKKSTHVDPDTLFKILDFFDKKRLRMVCYNFKDFQWKVHERRINELFKEINPSHEYRDNYYRFYEKLLGILYYYSLQQISVDKGVYNVIACHESSIDIWEVFRTMLKLAKRDGFKIKPTANIRKIEHLLKMADYVAGASRKIDDFKVNTIERYTLLRDPIRDFDLKKIFNIW